MRQQPSRPQARAFFGGDWPLTAAPDVSLGEVCDLINLAPDAACALCADRFARVLVARGEALIAAGCVFSGLFVVVRGAFKTCLSDDDGNEAILAFPASADVLGIDGIGAGVHRAATVALTDSEVIALPFKQLGACARIVPGLDDALFRLFHRELTRERRKIVLINSLSVEARAAFFLLDQSDRCALQGADPHALMLAMTPQDIAAYVGAPWHAVSVALATFTAAGLITLAGSRLQINGARGVSALRGYLPQDGLPPSGQGSRGMAALG